MTTGFIIFTVVWTLAVILFIIAMIAMDLATLKKAGQNDEQTINLGGSAEDVDGFSTQNVIEDPNSGGFNFITPDDKVDEQSEIAEADETSEASTETEEKPDNSEDVEKETSETDSFCQQSESKSTDETAGNEGNDTDESQETEEAEDDSFPGIRTVDYEEASEPELKEGKTFDAQEAFNPSLRQARYDVKDMYEPSVSPEVQSHADTVNESMESIQTRGSNIISTDLRAAMRSRLRENQKFDLRDECNKF